MERILVTGLGIISPIGNNVEENLNALRKGHCGISHLEVLSSNYAGLLPAGEIKISTNKLKEMLAPNESGVTRTSILALHAIKDAISSSGLSKSDLNSPETALISATTVGGMCLTDELYQDANLLSGGSEYLSSYDMASTTLYLQSKLNIGGVVNTINTACSSSANAIAYGARLIRQGHAKRAVVGGVDSLAKFTVNGFNSLMILSNQLCRPFDSERSGLNLGEGAAFLVLEREEDIDQKPYFAELKGYANSNDAFHPSSLSDTGDGPFLAMQKALANAKLQPEEIDYINSHGTGTENNDLSESVAMKRVFEREVAFTSTKSNIGHTLGAAGAIEAVYCVLNLQHQEIYPQLRFEQAISETGLKPVQSYSQKKLRHVMSNSFGFGGNCSSLIFSRA